MKRVALYFPKDHPVSPGAVAAYKLGRIEDGVHNANIFGEITQPFDEFVEELAAAARKEYGKSVEVVVEHLVHDNPEHNTTEPDRDVALDTSTWIPDSKFDPKKHTHTRAGNQATAELRADVSVRSS